MGKTVSQVSALAETLKRLREDSKLSIRQLAIRSGMSHTYLAQLEKGNARKGTQTFVEPSYKVLRKIASALGPGTFGALAASLDAAPSRVIGRAHVDPTAGSERDDVGLSAAKWIRSDQLTLVLHRATQIMLDHQPTSMPELTSRSLDLDAESGLHMLKDDSLLGTYAAALDPSSESWATGEMSLGQVLKQLIEAYDDESNPAYRLLADGIQHQESHEVDDAIECYERAIRRTTNPIVQGNIDRVLGRLYSRQYKNARALAHLRRAFEQLSAILTPTEASTLCAEIGWLSCLSGSPQVALEFFQTARDKATSEKVVASKLIRDCLHGMATSYSYLGDYTKAHALDEEAADIATRAKDLSGMAWSSFAIGMDCRNLGDWRRAEEQLEAASFYAAQHDVPVLQAMCKNELGYLSLWRGETVKASDLCVEALSINRVRSIRWGIPHSLELLGSIHSVCLGSQELAAESALACYMQALASFALLDCDFRRMTCTLKAAELIFSIGQPDQAKWFLEEGLAVATRRSYRLGQAIGNRLAGSRNTEVGNFDKAREQLAASLHLSEEIKDPFELAKTHLALALLGLRSDDRDLVRRHLPRARNTFVELGAIPGQRRALELAGA